MRVGSILVSLAALASPASCRGMFRSKVKDGVMDKVCYYLNTNSLATNNIIVYL